ncbi:MAG: pentapeptide repeat-containing protein [Chlorobiaceae bacterium]|nr:pentapeptide repeat-containing protein [Chlorobiaceae bacterium]
MANPGHLAILNNGRDVWNKWREENAAVEPDLIKANFEGAKLYGFNLKCANLNGSNLKGAKLYGSNLEGSNLRGTHLEGAKLYGSNLKGSNLEGAKLYGSNLEGSNLMKSNLMGAKLCEANLKEAHLHGSNLDGANLESANLEGANLEGANLYRAILLGSNMNGAYLNGSNLEGANLNGAHLNGSNLKEANLKEANLKEANLKEAHLHGANLEGSNLEGANLERAYLDRSNLKKADLKHTDISIASLIDANLDGANLTGAKLWEATRSGWSIKDVICEYVYFDREGKHKTEFAPGEFERLYSEKARIVLQYKDGLTRFELATLPMLIQFVERNHPGCRLRWKSFQEDAGGESATIVIEDLGNCEEEKLRAEVEGLKNQIREKEERLLAARSEYEGLQKFMFNAMKEFSMLNVNIEGDNYGPIGKKSKVERQIINNHDPAAISNLINEILAIRTDIVQVLSPEQSVDFDAAIKDLQAQVVSPQKDQDSFKKGLTKLGGFVLKAMEHGANLSTIATAFQAFGIHLPFG